MVKKLTLNNDQWWYNDNSTSGVGGYLEVRDNREWSWQGPKARSPRPQGPMQDGVIGEGTASPLPIS